MRALKLVLEADFGINTSARVPDQSVARLPVPVPARDDHAAPGIARRKREHRMVLPDPPARQYTISENLWKYRNNVRMVIGL